MPQQFGNTSFLQALDRTDGWSSSEGILIAFESAWREGREPQIQEFLRDAGPARLALLIELVHTELEFRL